MTAVVDDMLTQARHAAAIAATGCEPTGCEWYHGVWPALRAVGAVASPERHRSFFSLAMTAGDTTEPRVLVSGSADGAMVTEVLHAMPDAKLTVVDRCTTAVEVAVATAERLGRTAQGVVADLLSPLPDVGRFDMIVTHGLFGMTPAADRKRLAGAWSGLLAPEGRLITTTSLSSSGATGPVGFTSASGEAFAAHVHARAQHVVRTFGDEALGCTPDQLAIAALAWSRRAKADPVRSVDEVRAILAAAGLSPSIEIRDVAGALAADASGPWSARSGRYAHIVAVSP